MIQIALNIAPQITQRNQWFYCEDHYAVIKNIQKLSEQIPTIVVNTKHKKTDNQLNYMPPHMIDNDPMSNFLIESSIRNQGIFKKSSISCMKNEHVTKTVNNFGKEIIFSGFLTSYDLMISVFDSIDMGFSPSVFYKGTGDLTKFTKHEARKMMELHGIKEYA